MKLVNLAALALPLLTAVAHELTSYQWRHQCPQLEPLFPDPLNPKESKKVSGLDEYLSSEKFLNISVARLSGAVKIDTVSQDWWQDLPGTDPIWKHMKKFRKYLKRTFPLIHHHLDLEKVNKHGLVYTWKGGNPYLKPTLLLAHQDVVPVPDETISEWKYPPFSGHFDQKYVWGRGAFDCKNTLIGIMSAVEALLKVGWKPQRTLILAFGFDEEISGFQGAMRIAQHLEERYGKNGIALLIDEGPGIFHHHSTTVALPALSEKGSFNVNISVHMNSGHSSLSTGHNSITVMSALIGKIYANKLHGEVQTDDPFLQAVFCLGQHAPCLGQVIIEDIEKIDRNQTNINDLLRLPRYTISMPFLKPLSENTQTLAMIQGGVKMNMIPERTTLSINHRLQLGTSIDQAKGHLEQIVKDHIAEININGTNLSFRDWSEPEAVNSIKLTALPGAKEASPITPFSVDGTTPYSILQRTIRSLYGDKNLTLVAPTSLPANTDTRHYWNLTQHIFRFTPGHDMRDSTDHYVESNIHNTNEHANIFGHVNGVRWFSLFIRNMDDADLA